MALVNLVSWGSVTKSLLDAAFAHAGGKLATIHAEAGDYYSTSIGGFHFYVGEGTSGNNIAAVALGGSNDRFFVGAKADDAGNAFGGVYSQASTNIRIVATKAAVAVMNVDANGVSKMGIVFTTDNNSDLCCVVIGDSLNTLANPAIVPRDPLYTTKIQYEATTSNAFGATSLSLIPVPSFDGSAKFLPNASFAHAAQYIVDGEVTLDGLRYYCIGGSWWLKDTIEEVS